MVTRIGYALMAAFVVSCGVGSLAAYAEEAKPAADARGEVKFVDGRYRLPDGTPTYNITPMEGGGKKVDWATWQGFRRYHDACHVCHGPEAGGSTFAPALKDSLKTMSYDDFLAVVSSGREVNRAGTEYVMPAFATNRDVMCYLDDIYTYIKAKADDAAPPGRPPGREDISEEAKKAANECLGD